MAGSKRPGLWMPSCGGLQLALSDVFVVPSAVGLAHIDCFFNAAWNLLERTITAKFGCPVVAPGSALTATTVRMNSYKTFIFRFRGGLNTQKRHLRGDQADGTMTLRLLIGFPSQKMHACFRYLFQKCVKLIWKVEHEIGVSFLGCCKLRCRGET